MDRGVCTATPYAFVLRTTAPWPGADGTESGEAEMSDPEARRGDGDGEDDPMPAAATADDGSDDKRRSAFSSMAPPIKVCQLITI